MPRTHANGKLIATEGSGHVAPGPPAGNGIMPITPAGTFTPAAFVYVSKSSSANHHGATTRGNCKVSDKKILVKGSCMDIEQPGNFVAKACENKPTGADLSNMVCIGLGKVMSAGGTDVKIGRDGDHPALTGDPVALNVPTVMEKSPGMGLHQSQSQFIEGVGLTQADIDAFMKAFKVVAVGDPVAVVSGEVVDEVVDLWLPGTFDFEWKRLLASGRRLENGPFGRGGFTHNFHQWLTVDEDRVTLRNEDGREVSFAAPPPRSEVMSRRRSLGLTRVVERYDVRDLVTGRVREFSPIESGGRPVLRSLRDRWGNRIELVYEHGRLTAIMDTAKREIRLDHDSGGRITSLDVRARGESRRRITYEYDGNGDLAAIVNALGERDAYRYDAKHRLIEKELRSGLCFRYAYEANGDRCVQSRAQGNLRNVELFHEPEKRTVSVFGNPEPRIYVYDVQGDIVRVSTPDGSKALDLTYDEDQLVTSVTDASGATWTMEYDEHGHMLALTGPGGVTTSWEYQDDQAVRRVDPANAETRFSYDEHGTLIKVVEPSGRFFVYDYDRFGRLVAIAGADGRIAEYAFDDEHNIIGCADAHGSRWTSTFDPLGMPLVERDPLGHVNRYTYDALGRLTKHQMPDGTELTFEYDRSDNVVRSSDANATVLTERTATGLIARRTLADGTVWEFQHDILDRLREIRNPRGEVFEYRYDRAGRLLEEISFDGEVTRLQHGRDNLLKRTEFIDDTWLEFVHDERRGVVEERSPHGDKRYERDDYGRILRAVYDDPHGEIVVERTWKDGRVVVEAVNGRETQFEYDRSGRRVARVLPNGETTRYRYDVGGELVGIEHEGYQVLLERDVLGRVVRRHDPVSGLNVRASYDANHQLLEQRAVVERGGGDVMVAHRRYAYGPHARLHRVDDVRFGLMEYVHDAKGLLEAARSRVRVEAFEYNAAGALIQTRRSGETAAEPWVTRAGDVLLRTHEHAYEYDARRRRAKRIRLLDGRPTGEVTEYDWDCRNQLREIRLPSGVRVVFTYDLFSRRVRKTVVTPPPHEAPPYAPPAVRTVEYVWDENELAMEIDSERGVRVFVHRPGTFVPILQRENGETYSCITDHIGVPREIVDAHGRLVWAGATSAWGDVLEVAPVGERSAPERVESPFRLLGHYRDDETDLAYVRYRYFDSSAARWLSPDPLGFWGGEDLFGWNGSPTEHVDPLGLTNRADFQKFLDKFAAKRKQAAENTEAERARRIAAAAAKGKPPRGDDVFSMSDRGEVVGIRHSSNDPTTGRDAHAEVNLGQREGTGDRAVAANIPHCGNCTQQVYNRGDVTASPIRSDPKSPPFFNPPNIPPNAPPDPRW